MSVKFIGHVSTDSNTNEPLRGPLHATIILPRLFPSRFLQDPFNRHNLHEAIRLLHRDYLAPTVLWKAKITCCAFVDNFEKQCLIQRCKVHLLYLQLIWLTYSGRLPLLLVTSRVLSTCDGQKCSLCPRVRACARGYFSRQHFPFETN